MSAQFTVFVAINLTQSDYYEIFQSTPYLYNTMTHPELEEKLREAACFGDIDGVKELINK